MTDDLDRRIASAVARIAAERPPVGDVRFPGAIVPASSRAPWPRAVSALAAFVMVVAAGVLGFSLARVGDSRPVASAPERVVIAAPDGAELSAVFYPGEGDGVVLGTAYGWDAEALAPVARPLSAAGLPVLVVELRGVGSSPGPTDVDLMPRDLSAAVNWMAARADGRVFLMGFSHSGTGALVAAADPALPIAGVAAMMGFPEYQGLDATQAMERISVPVHLVGASQDAIFSSAGWALELFSRANEPKTIEVLPALGAEDGFMDFYASLMADSMLIFMGGV